MAMHIAALALALAGATSNGQSLQALEQEHQALKMQLAALDYASFNKGDVDADDFAECHLSFPLPTTPVGPTAVKQFNFPGKAPVELTFWRHPCDHDDGIVMVTVKPVGPGENFFCGTELNVVQRNVQSTSVQVGLDPHGQQSLCGPVLVPTTGWLNVRMPREFDHEDPFTAHSARFQGPASLPGYSVQDYPPPPGHGNPPPGQGNPPPPAPSRVKIDEDFSGSWYNRSETVKNQGWFLEFSDDSRPNRQALAAWFTGNANGTQLMWYTAHGSYNGNQAQLKLYRSDNVTFGGNTGSTHEVGTLKFTFDTCTSGTAEWQFNDGSRGSLPITRMIAAPDDCD